MSERLAARQRVLQADDRALRGPLIQKLAHRAPAIGLGHRPQRRALGLEALGRHCTRAAVDARVGHLAQPPSHGRVGGLGVDRHAVLGQPAGEGHVRRLPREARG